MIELVFLGCGGGRHQTIDQRFGTGGFRVHGDLKLHVDPGPGALLLTHQLGLNPLDLDCVIASHCHPDHYTDAEVLVEAMTQHTTRKRGVLVGSESVLSGKDKWGPAISSYHQSWADKVVCMRPGDSLELGDLKLEATPTKHNDPTTFGLKFHSASGIIGYTNDTEYFESLPGYFEGSRLLILNITRPLDRRIRWHLCSDDAIKILKEVKPELAVMVHMGMLFVRHPPEREAARIERESRTEIIPGHIGTRVRLDGEINVKRPVRQPSLEAFMGTSFPL